MEAKPLTNHYIPEIPLFKVAEIKVFFQLLQKLQQLNRCILCNSSPVHHFREVTEMVFWRTKPCFKKFEEGKRFLKLFEETFIGKKRKIELKPPAGFDDTAYDLDGEILNFLRGVEARRIDSGVVANQGDTGIGVGDFLHGGFVAID